MPIPPDLQIFYPNGGTSATQMYIWDSINSKPIAWDGSVSVSVSSSGSAIEDGVTNTIKATVFDIKGGGGNSNPLATQIVDANGDAIVSFGGGTQYTEGDTTSPAVGTVSLWRKAGGNLVAVDATNPLPISVAALPLPSNAAQETGGNLDTIVTPIATIGTTPLQRVAIFDASNNQITSFGGAGGTSAIDDAAFTAGVDLGTPIMGFATSDVVNSGDVGVLAMDVNRNLKVSLELNNAGLATAAAQTDGTQKTIVVDSSGNDLDFFKNADNYTSGTDHGLMILAIDDGAPTKFRPLQIDTSMSDGESNSLNRLLTEAYGQYYNGSTWDRVRGTAADGALVNLGTNNDVTVTSGTVTATIAAKQVLWDAAVASGGTVLTTELNSLADGAFSGVGSEYNNSTAFHRFGWLDISLASLNPTTGAYLQVFMIATLDGTNYPDAPSSTNPGLQYLVTPLLNVATGSAAKRIVIPPFLLPPAKIKFVLYNKCNVALASSGNTVTLYTADEEIQ